MRWLVLTQCDDAGREADPSPPPPVVQPRTVLVPLLPHLVPLLLLLLLVIFYVLETLIKIISK
jgi:hypothetical protein